MKKKLIVVLIIIGIIVAATTGALIYNYYHTSKNDATLSGTYKGQLPTVEISYGDTTVCHPDGYLKEPEESLNRQCIIPVSPDRKVPVKVLKNGNEIKTIAFEVKAMDDHRLIDSGQIDQWDNDKDTAQFDYVASAIMEIGEEYLFCFTFETDKYEKIFYNARIMLTDTEFVSEQIKFLKHFSEMTFDTEHAKELALYIEPDLSYPNDDLGQVTIKSSYSMLIWNTLVPEKTGDVTIHAKEFCIKDTGEAGTYTMNYRIKSTNAEKVEEYYNVSETITVWTCAGKQYVLAYDREVNQIWTADNNNIGNSFIDLGIQNFDEAQYLESENGQYLSFCINGDIYVMDVTTKTVTPIYKLDAKDSETINKTRTKLLSINNSGDVDYIIYGYSPAKQHIGKNGISVMKYTMKEKSSKEHSFIVCDYPPGRMEEEISKLCHLGDGAVYIKLGNSIYYVNIQTKETGKLVENMDEGSFRVSEDGSMLAYNTDGKFYDENSITVVNLNDGKMQTISAEENKAIKVFGYTEENLVYGLADKKDLGKGYSFFPVSKLVIADKNLKEVKSYSKKNVFITDVEITDTIIHIKQWKNGKKTSGDQLLFNPEGKTTLAYSSHWTDDIKQKELAIAFTNNLDADVELSVNKDATVVFDDNASVDPSVSTDVADKFFVYGYGKLQGIYDNKKEAAKEARKVYGLVTNNNGRKIWVFEENYNE